jgi:predicted outer membrane repeat protein
VENYANYHGGGMHNDDAISVTVTDCTFKDNYAGYDGGGMYNYESDSIAVTNSLFTGNYTESGNGGGMYNEFSSPNITGCVFVSNEAFRSGAIHNNYSSPLIGNCTFTDNTAFYGGAIHNNESSLSITKCIFRGNDAEHGGAIYSMTANVSPREITFTNCIFNNNESTYAGGAIVAGYQISTYVTNCTFSGNLSGTDGGAIYNAGLSRLFITNCILWNSGKEIHDIASIPATVKYSDVQGGWPGDGNIDADPLFVNAPTDVSLRAGSPCIDAGTDTSSPEYGSVTDDILGVARPQYRAYDMGAYEYVAKSTWSPVSIMPLARTQLATALEEWNALSEELPEEPSDGMTELIERIQAHMQNATGLANPIYASGELAKALSLMGELSALIG